MQICRYLILLLLLSLAFTLSGGCTTTPSSLPANGTAVPVTGSGQPAETVRPWTSIPVTDAVTGTETTIHDLAEAGQPVVMHTFAVWCPACSMQLRETQRLLGENPGRFQVLGVDIDPRESTDLIRSHIQKNGFTGIYVPAPEAFTRSLMETVGYQVVSSLPQTVIICNRTVVYIGDGVYPASRLDQILAEICGPAPAGSSP